MIFGWFFEATRPRVDGLGQIVEPADRAQCMCVFALSYPGQSGHGSERASSQDDHGVK